MRGTEGPWRRQRETRHFGGPEGEEAPKVRGAGENHVPEGAGAGRSKVCSHFLGFRMETVPRGPGDSNAAGIKGKVEASDFDEQDRAFV